MSSEVPPYIKRGEKKKKKNCMKKKYQMRGFEKEIEIKLPSISLE